MNLIKLSSVFNEMAKRMPNLATEAIQSYLPEIQANLLNRIFNDNLGANGGSFGGYKSKQYKEYRLSIGRQVTRKDLQLTGQFKNSIIINNDALSIEFSKSNLSYKRKNKTYNSIPLDIAKGQETQIKKLIFEPSKEEIESAKDAVTANFRDLILKELGL
jgi:hypothetical protein